MSLKKNTKTTYLLYLATMLLPLAAIAAPNAASCSTGKLLDVQVDTEMIQVGTTERGEDRQRKNGKREYNTYSTSITQEKTTYTVTVEIDDMVYTAQSQGIFGFGFKPTAFVIKDPIQGCVQGNTLALRRPDGKQYKAHIVRAVRSGVL
jgi:hypothetical protein